MAVPGTKTMDDYPAGAVLGLGLADDPGGIPVSQLGADELRARPEFRLATLKQNKALLQNQTLIFILLFCGFAIRMPLFPFHGWLPILAEQSAVASVSIFLVGLKLGIYAMARFILPVVTEAAEHWAGFVVTLGLITIFYGALLALMQINIRRLFAFSVISHAGMLVIGCSVSTSMG